ncbi:MAG: hypothetical protein QM681_01400 [Novosphingobium sp.]
MQKQQWWFRAVTAHVNEVERLAVDRRAVLGDGVQTLLDAAPVEFIDPISK